MSDIETDEIEEKKAGGLDDLPVDQTNEESADASEEDDANRILNQEEIDSLLGFDDDASG